MVEDVIYVDFGDATPDHVEENQKSLQTKLYRTDFQSHGYID